MVHSISRRSALTGLAAALAAPARAEAPARSLRPLPRPAGARAVLAPDAYSIVERARLGGAVGYAVADLETGRILEVMNPILPLPPASTAKAITALYAMDTLGPNYRFVTQLVATGPVRDGRLDGDLILVGGGDPTLDTDALGDMVLALKEAGVREVTGQLRINTAALPTLRQIDPEQPDHMGYNPSVGALNLNFNRVHFSWSRTSKGHTVAMQARADRFRPEVNVARMQVVNRSLPIYTYKDADQSDNWTVARAALGRAGSRWLPVRRPAKYCTEVLLTLARAQGIALRGSGTEGRIIRGEVLVEHTSPRLRDVAQAMLKHSTNLTAEVLGMTASRSLGMDVRGLEPSAERMTKWLDDGARTRGAALKDHSGLNDDSRITAADMVQALVRLGPEGALGPLMKGFDVAEAPGGSGTQVNAKTGTLHFVSGLAGYAEVPGDRRLAFAIFAADVPRRSKLRKAERERPEGAAAWNKRARDMQRRLIGRWATAYGA